MNKNKPVSREELDYMITMGKDISQVNTSKIIDMSNLFKNDTYRYHFNDDISNWDVSNVTDMSNMFKVVRLLIKIYQNGTYLT